MAASSSSFLGRISILKPNIESSSASPSGSLFNQNRNLKFNQQQQQQKQKRIVAQGCSTSSIDQNNTKAVVSGSSSTTNAYLDTVFGTELKKKQQQQSKDNAVVREIKVGVDRDEEEEKVLPHISADKLDEWMAFSVPEIVKNIGDAPLLVHIYSSMSKGVHGLSSIGSSSSSSPVAKPIPIIKKTKADAKSWTGVTKRWEEGSQIPDGIIFVEQLKTEDGGENESEVMTSDMSETSSTKTWGVVIQGRGVESASSCYILKTCRVGSSLGFCTHFCLARAKCFGESADLQLKNSWLLGY